MDLGKSYSSLYNQSNFIKHGGNIYQESIRLGIDKNKLLDASASIVPFSHPKELQASIQKTLQEVQFRNYPDRSHTKLKQSISEWHNIDPSMVLPGNGAAELITWAGRDAAKAGVSILPVPGFLDYKRSLNCWNSTYREIPLPLDWDSKFPQSFPFQSFSSNVIWITNPHNPTGQLWSRSSLEALLATHKLVICDEAFLPLVPNGEKESLIPLTNHYKNLIVIRSLTKLFSIAGIRLGYAISEPNRLKEWQSWRDPWPLNTIAISIGCMLMNNQTLLKQQIKKVERWILKEGEWLHANLSQLPGIIAHPSATNFQLIQGEQSLIDFREAIAQKGILLRDCRSFIGLGDSWLRISLQTKVNNQRIIEEMQKLLR